MFFLLYLANLFSCISLIFCSSILTNPLLGFSSPPNKCSNVDLPLPLGPIIAINSPLFIVKLTLSKATTSISPFPYFFVKSIVSNIFIRLSPFIQLNL